MTPLVGAYVLSALVGLGIIFVGGRFLVAPSVGATGHGVAPGKVAYLSAKGVRDIVSGLFVFVLIGNGAPHVLGWIMGVATLIPAADAVIRPPDHAPGPAPYRKPCGHVGGRHVVPSFQLILSRANPFRFAGADARRTSDSRAALRGLDDVASCAYAMTFRKALDRGRENRRFFSAAARVWLTATAP